MTTRLKKSKYQNSNTISSDLLVRHKNLNLNSNSCDRKVNVKKQAQKFVRNTKNTFFLKINKLQNVGEQRDQ